VVRCVFVRNAFVLLNIPVKNIIIVKIASVRLHIGESVLTKLTLDESKNRYASTGQCYHEEEFQVITKPYKCGIKLTDCGVCGERINLVYLS